MAGARPGRHRPRSDRGSAVAEFALVAALLALVVLAMLQLGFALHVRNTLVSAAVEGARHGARLENGPADAQQRTRELIDAALSARFADDVRVSEETVDGVPVTRVVVRAPLPLIGPWGPGEALEVRGQALREGAG